MKMEKVAFSAQKDRILHFISNQNISLPNALARELLLFLSKACSYEEESNKIKPSIIIGSNLQSNEFTSITQSTAVCFVNELIARTNLSNRLKSILPFCNNGWRVFIDIIEDSISYGIMRSFNGPSGLNIVDILANLESDEKESLNANYALIDIINSYEIHLKGNDALYKIDFRLEEDDYDSELARRMFCEDILSHYRSEDSKPKIAYEKVVDLFSQKLHGSICFVVKHDYTLPDTILADGIFLENPIDIYTVLADDLNENMSASDIRYIISSHEKYHALTGLFLEMLNIDGITIVDNRGRIRAYNVFIKPDADAASTVSGGARRRAAKYLEKQLNPNYIGVYFQSQDGTATYERVVRE